MCSKWSLTILQKGETALIPQVRRKEPQIIVKKQTTLYIGICLLCIVLAAGALWSAYTSYQLASNLITADVFSVGEGSEQEDKPKAQAAFLEIIKSEERYSVQEGAMLPLSDMAIIKVPDGWDIKQYDMATGYLQIQKDIVCVEFAAKHNDGNGSSVGNSIISSNGTAIGQMNVSDSATVIIMACEESATAETVDLSATVSEMTDYIFAMDSIEKVSFLGFDIQTEVIENMSLYEGNIYFKLSNRIVGCESKSIEEDYKKLFQDVISEEENNITILSNSGYTANEYEPYIVEFPDGTCIQVVAQQQEDVLKLFS